MKSEKVCESCFYFGTATDAPETVEPDCMWQPTEEDGWEPPCEKPQLEGNEKDIVAESDLTLFFTEELKGKKVIEAARIVERTDDSKAIEIKFYSHITQEERVNRIEKIGILLLRMCAEAEDEKNEESKEFLEFMDGVQIKEWEEEPEKTPGKQWQENIMNRFMAVH